jgi:hypothetical protein
VGNNYYLSQSKSQQKEWKIPMGDQAVPWNDPDWNPWEEKHEWEGKCFTYCVIDGLRRDKIKPLNYSQVTAVQQGKSEPPVTFL